MGFVSLQSFTNEAKGFFGLHLSTLGLGVSRHRPSAFSLRSRPSPSDDDLGISPGIYHPFDDLLPDRRRFDPLGPQSAPLMGFRSLRRLRSVSPPTPACQHRLRCRSCRFSRLQRRTPRSTLPGSHPGNVLGILEASRDFPCCGSVTVTGFRPSWRSLEPAQALVRHHLQGIDLHFSPLPPTTFVGARFPLDLFSSRVSSARSPSLGWTFHDLSTPTFTSAAETAVATCRRLGLQRPNDRSDR